MEQPDSTPTAPETPIVPDRAADGINPGRGIVIGAFLALVGFWIPLLIVIGFAVGATA